MSTCPSYTFVVHNDCTHISNGLAAGGRPRLGGDGLMSTFSGVTDNTRGRRSLNGRTSSLTVEQRDRRVGDWKQGDESFDRHGDDSYDSRRFGLDKRFIRAPAQWTLRWTLHTYLYSVSHPSLRRPFHFLQSPFYADSIYGDF